jgi:hypothetical protein
LYTVYLIVAYRGKALPVVGSSISQNHLSTSCLLEILDRVENEIDKADLLFTPAVRKEAVSPQLYH